MGHELDTDLRPGETLLANCAVQFPSGQYKRVWGFRSFRDFQGRDVSDRLPGWPPSNQPSEPPAKKTAQGRVKSGLWTATAVAGYVIEGLTSGFDDWPSSSDFETDDYPVLRADPGTLAFGAPWRLDPGRNKIEPRVILHVTTQRLLFSDPMTDEVLWEIGRQDIKDMTPEIITEVTFVDDSWIRIALVKDKNIFITDSEKYYVTKTVKGKPTRISLTSEPHLKFIGNLKDFLGASHAESA